MVWQGVNATSGGIWGTLKNIERTGDRVAVSIAGKSEKDLTTLLLNKSTAPEILAQLATFPREYIREMVADHPNTSPQILSSLWKDKRAKVRWGVSKNPNTPIETLTELSMDSDTDICGWVAANPSTPTSLLVSLSGYDWSTDELDEDVGADSMEEMKEARALRLNAIREGLAQNPNTPTWILEKLGEEEDYAIRQDLANNPSTPSNIIERLQAMGVTKSQVFDIEE